MDFALVLPIQTDIDKNGTDTDTRIGIGASLIASCTLCIAS